MRRMKNMRNVKMEIIKQKERFTLTQKSNGLWEGRDTENGIIVTFREHRFTETQKVTIEADCNNLGSIMSAKEMPTYLQELEYWLLHCHYNVLMPSLLDRRAEMGKRVNELRTAKGWSQAELAARAGITVGNVIRIEAGKYSTGIDQINRLCDALGVTLAIL